MSQWDWFCGIGKAKILYETSQQGWNIHHKIITKLTFSTSTIHQSKGLTVRCKWSNLLMVEIWNTVTSTCYSIYVQKCISLDVCSLLVNIKMCRPLKSKRDAPACHFRVSICVWAIFRSGLGLLFIEGNTAEHLLIPWQDRWPFVLAMFMDSSCFILHSPT